MPNPKIQTEKEIRDATDAEVRAQIAYAKKMRDIQGIKSPMADFMLGSKGREKADSDYLNLETYSKLPSEDLRVARNLEEAGQAIEEADAEKLRESRKGKPPSTMDKIRSSIGMKKGGKVSSASKRADGIAQRGKTRGKFV